MSYQIITDSCCDLTEQMLKELDVLCVPLTVMYNGENHENFSDETAVKAFYDELRRGVTATTAAVNPDGWASLMEPSLEQGKDILASFRQLLLLGLKAPYILKLEHQLGLPPLGLALQQGRKAILPFGSLNQISFQLENEPAELSNSPPCCPFT